MFSQLLRHTRVLASNHRHHLLRPQPEQVLRGWVCFCCTKRSYNVRNATGLVVIFFATAPKRALRIHDLATDYVDTAILLEESRSACICLCKALGALPNLARRRVTMKIVCLFHNLPIVFSRIRPCATPGALHPYHQSHWHMTSCTTYSSSVPRVHLLHLGTHSSQTAMRHWSFAKSSAQGHGL